MTACISRAARTACSGSSSCATSAPHTAINASPMCLSIRPPRGSDDIVELGPELVHHIRQAARRRVARTATVKPRTSPKTTVTWRRLGAGTRRGASSRRRAATARSIDLIGNDTSQTFLGFDGQLQLVAISPTGHRAQRSEPRSRAADAEPHQRPCRAPSVPGSGRTTPRVRGSRYAIGAISTPCADDRAVVVGSQPPARMGSLGFGAVTRCLLRASTEGGAVSQARFQKQQREKARRERAAAKWAKRAERAKADAPEPAEPVREQADVLADLATLHARFDAGEMTLRGLRSHQAADDRPTRHPLIRSTTDDHQTGRESVAQPVPDNRLT